MMPRAERADEKISVAASTAVRNHPFAHILADRWLEPSLYAALAASFPTCPARSGPTGYTLFRGDPEYDRLVSEHPAWSTFFQLFQSQRFVDEVLAAFPDAFRTEARVDLSRARYLDWCESREDKERARLAPAAHDADRLWVRVDIMQGWKGYHRLRHLDHRRRAASMLIYFCDADEAGMHGGDLILHGPDGAAVTVRPRHNRMVMFPCTAASLHSVSMIRRQRAPRNFVQVTLSSFVDLWGGVTPRPTFWERSMGRVRHLRRRLGVR